MNRYILALVPLLSTCLTSDLYAQETATQDSAMNRTMRLERDFSPIVQQKNKIDRQPATQEIQSKKNDATLADWQVAAVRSSEVGVVPAGQVIATSSKEEDGYFELSAGNYWNTNLKAGLIFDEFRLDANGFFTKGKHDLPHKVYNPDNDSLSEQSWQLRYLTGDVKGTFERELGNEALFSAHFGATGTAVNTFNYQFYKNSTDTLVKVASKPSHQHWGKIFGDLSYETDLFTFGAYYDYSRLTTPDSLPCNWAYNTLLFKGKIGWYDNDTWKANIDLDMGGVFGKKKSYFIFHPTLHLSLLTDPLAWRRFYLDLGFGSRRSDLDELMKHIPIAYFDEEYKNSVDAMDLHIGYEDNDQGYLRWGIEMQLNSVKNAICTEAVAVDTTHRDGLYMRIFQDDDFHFGISAHADYEYSRYFGLQTVLQINTHSSTEAYLLQPAFDLDVHAISHPGDFTFDLGFNIASESRAFYNKQDYSLGPNFRIGFRSDWQCNEELKLFLLMHGVTGGINEVFPGLPQQKFDISAGFRWEF